MTMISRTPDDRSAGCGGGTCVLPASRVVTWGHHGQILRAAFCDHHSQLVTGALTSVGTDHTSIPLNDDDVVAVSEDGDLAVAARHWRSTAARVMNAAQRSFRRHPDCPDEACGQAVKALALAGAADALNSRSWGWRV